MYSICFKTNSNTYSHNIHTDLTQISCCKWLKVYTTKTADKTCSKSPTNIPNMVGHEELKNKT